MRWIRVQSNRMELYALAALLLALVTLGYSVSGLPRSAPGATVQNGGSLLTLDFWRTIFCLLVLAVAFLFYKSRQIKPQGEKRGASEGNDKPQRSQLSLHQYGLLVGSFLNLTWAQKVAIKVLCERRLNHEIGLRLELERMGFGSGQELMERIVKPVCASRLVDYGKTGEITLKQASLADIEEIVNGWDYRF